jgi:S1-C subfamily serine protease
MQIKKKSAPLLALLTAATLSAQSAKADTDIDAKAKEVAKSLVVVEYTIRNENASAQESGQGILISKDVILISGALIPEALPKDWLKELKVRLPLKNFTSVPAKFLGRTQDRMFAFIKLDTPTEAPIFQSGDMTPPKMGDTVFSIALLGKAGGYTTYVGVARVKTIMDLTHVVAATTSFGLTKGTSPVFSAETGKLIGITLPASGEGMTIREGNTRRNISLTDDEQSSTFLPQDEIKDLFKNIPNDHFELRRPWLGVDQITGLQEEVRTLKNIDQTAGVIVSSVIANEAADKAGLKSSDIILTVNGKEFSKSPVAEHMVMHFSRMIEKMKPGDVVTLGVLRDGAKTDIKVTLKESPKQSSEVPHVFSAKVGVTTRDLVFADAYARRLPQDTKGVMIALVKNGSPASLGTTPLRTGYLVTKVDEEAIENNDQFLAAMKKLEENKEAKESVFVVIQPNGETTVCRIDLTK